MYSFKLFPGVFLFAFRKSEFGKAEHSGQWGFQFMRSIGEELFFLTREVLFRRNIRKNDNTAYLIPEQLPLRHDGFDKQGLILKSALKAAVCIARSVCDFIQKVLIVDKIHKLF